MEGVARREAQIEVEVEIQVGVEAGEGWGRGNMGGVLFRVAGLTTSFFLFRFAVFLSSSLSYFFLLCSVVRYSEVGGC